ncbi:hypothetical protein OP10G_3520 [Fimbriimonas ginsengisoli Gsoil 348]|uniref:Uncharacterized protein n=2 Tax=Fimbriimonas ginsengisoli TaxID=1005039 RepID=A0A068NTK9_FIMGI|nr:hypothetical protein OP10G_3520 [Fimbriimonas ginsengisoli Gsoil 348]
MVDELVVGGVRPDDISLVAHHTEVDLPESTGDSRGGMREVIGVAGDASYFVGRDDDPEFDPSAPPRDGLEEFTTLEGSRIGGIDTSDPATDVDSVDQADDSQEEFEEMTYPRADISQSEHERDDLNLTLLTGFPTPVPVVDGLKDGATGATVSVDEALETIVVPGFGMVMGGGALATAALDFIKPDGGADTEAIVRHLRDEGVPETRARVYRDAFSQGGAVVAVAVNPGSVDEGAVESIAERHHAENHALYDAPRYYQDGGQRHERGGGAS